jgi:hypothetical protein
LQGASSGDAQSRFLRLGAPEIGKHPAMVLLLRFILQSVTLKYRQKKGQLFCLCSTVFLLNIGISAAATSSSTFAAMRLQASQRVLYHD